MEATHKARFITPARGTAVFIIIISESSSVNAAIAGNYYQGPFYGMVEFLTDPQEICGLERNQPPVCPHA